MKNCFPRVDDRRDSPAQLDPQREILHRLAGSIRDINLRSRDTGGPDETDGAGGRQQLRQKFQSDPGHAPGWGEITAWAIAALAREHQAPPVLFLLRDPILIL